MLFHSSRAHGHLKIAEHKCPSNVHHPGRVAHSFICRYMLSLHRHHPLVPHSLGCLLLRRLSFIDTQRFCLSFERCPPQILETRLAANEMVSFPMSASHPARLILNHRVNSSLHIGLTSSSLANSTNSHNATEHPLLSTNTARTISVIVVIATLGTVAALALLIGLFGDKYHNQPHCEAGNLATGVSDDCKGPREPLPLPSITLPKPAVVQHRPRQDHTLPRSMRSSHCQCVKRYEGRARRRRERYVPYPSAHSRARRSGNT